MSSLLSHITGVHFFFLSIAVLTIFGLRLTRSLKALLTLMTVVFALLLNPALFGVVCIFLVVTLLKQPLFVLVGSASAWLFYALSGYRSAAEFGVMADKMLEIANKDVFLAIPFFIVAGEVMSHGALAKRLLDVARATIGFLPGGLALSGVLGCVFFAALSGSSPVTVIAMGTVMLPALSKEGYSKKFSTGLLTSAGSLGILIPPSIPMLLYALAVGGSAPVDPRMLFVAGVIPGCFIAALLGAYAMFQGHRQKIQREVFSLPTWTLALRHGFWSLLLPIIVLGGIYLGIFTTTEAAAVSVAYVVIIEVFVHRALEAKELPIILAKSMRSMGALTLIVGFAFGLNQILVEDELPKRALEWMQSLELGRSAFLLGLNLFLLLLGCVMDIVSAILIVAPLVSPLALAIGIDPIHLGIIFIVNLEVGYLTPPLGLNLFVASALFDQGFKETSKAVLPTLLLLLFALFCVTACPWMSSGVAGMVRGEEAAQQKTLQDLVREGTSLNKSVLP